MGPPILRGVAGRPWPAGDHRFDSCRAATALIFSAVDPSTGPLSIPISAHFLAHEHLGPVAFPAIAESEIDRGAQDGLQRGSRGEVLVNGRYWIPSVGQLRNLVTRSARSS